MRSTNLRSKKTGLPPGSPVYIGARKAQGTEINLIGYTPTEESVRIAVDIKECVANKDKFAVLWLDVAGLGDIKQITELCESFGAHPLVIEDIFNTQQRPKIDIFDEYVFLTLRAYSHNDVDKCYYSQQVSVILGKNLVITICEDRTNDIFAAVKLRLHNSLGVIRKKGADYLTHALIDVIVDEYFSVVEIVGDRIELLEEHITERADAKVVKEIHSIKRELIFLRRSAWPLREVINGLQHHMDGLISTETVFYLKDVHDHTVQIVDAIETYRDFLAGMLEVYLSGVSNRLNEVMKVLTVFASIFIPLTFITGLYGMNFNTLISPFNMPELHWKYGYLFAWGLMLFVIVFMLVYFKRKKWW